MTELKLPHRLVTAADKCDNRVRLKIKANNSDWLDSLLIHLGKDFVVEQHEMTLVVGKGSPPEFSQYVRLGFDGELVYPEGIEWPYPPMRDYYGIEIFPNVPDLSPDTVGIKAHADPRALYMLYECLRAEMDIPFHSRCYQHPAQGWFMLMHVVPRERVTRKVRQAVVMEGEP